MMEGSSPEILTSNKSRQSQTVSLILLIKMYFPGIFQRKISAVKQVYHHSQMDELFRCMV